MSIAKFLRTLFYTEHLWWLLLHVTGSFFYKIFFPSTLFFIDIPLIFDQKWHKIYAKECKSLKMYIFSLSVLYNIFRICEIYSPLRPEAKLHNEIHNTSQNYTTKCTMYCTIKLIKSLFFFVFWFCYSGEIQ